MDAVNCLWHSQKGGTAAELKVKISRRSRADFKSATEAADQWYKVLDKVGKRNVWTIFRLLLTTSKKEVAYIVAVISEWRQLW